MSLADDIRAILDEEFADTGYPESAVGRLMALLGDRYQWGVRETWNDRMDGYVKDEERHSEGDARAVIAYWRRRVEQGRRSNIVEMRLLRRSLGEWEVVE